MSKTSKKRGHSLEEICEGNKKLTVEEHAEGLQVINDVLTRNGYPFEYRLAVLDDFINGLLYCGVKQADIWIAVRMSGLDDEYDFTQIWTERDAERQIEEML